MLQFHVVSFHEYLVTMEAAEWFSIRTRRVHHNDHQDERQCYDEQQNSDPLKVQHNQHQSEATCHDGQPFSCSHCDKKFTNSHPLNMHQNNHQNESFPMK